MEVAVDHQGSAHMGGKGGQGANTKQVHGPGSWAAIWGAFGFVIAIEGTFVQLLALPLKWPCNAVLSVGLYAVGGVLTVLLFTRGWFQRWLLNIKKRFEEKPRQ
jgi:hypothetical protein